MYTRDDCLQSKITSSIRLSDIIKFKNDDDFSINLTHIYVDPDQNLQEYFKKIPEIEIIIIYKSNVKLYISIAIVLSAIYLIFDYYFNIYVFKKQIDEQTELIVVPENEPTNQIRADLESTDQDNI